MQQQIDRNDLGYIANLNPFHKDSETLLLGFYKKIKSSWTPSAIRSLRTKAGLKLNSKVNRCEFAKLAAVEELRIIKNESHFFSSEPLLSSEKLKQNELTDALVDARQQLQELSSEKIKQLTDATEKAQHLENELKATQSELNKSKRFSFLLLTNRLLPAGEPLNGTEESPAMRILGSPKTLTELEANYRELVKREHPDVSAHEPELAAKRYLYVRSLVRFVRKHWDKFKPTAKISALEKQRRMNATTPYSPESFWSFA